MKKTIVLLMTIAFVFTVGSVFAADSQADPQPLSNGVTVFDLRFDSLKGSAELTSQEDVLPFNGITFYGQQQAGAGAQGSAAGGSSIQASTDKPAYNGITVF
jgi:hypothetical protein